jgi:SulP family sulfate permease
VKTQSKFQKYLKDNLHFDLIAGLTVAMIAIPQTMAYAIIAGVNPIYGLYSATLPAIIGSLFGSSSFLVTGASNASALAAASILVMYSQSSNYIYYIFALTLVSGVIKLILGLLKQGNIIRFISNSVLTGFLTGVGALIILNQVTNLLGLAKPVRIGTIEYLAHVIRSIKTVNLTVFGLGLATILLMVILKKINRKIPSALLVIILSAICVSVFNLDDLGVKSVGDISAITNFSLSFSLPGIPFKDWSTILIGGITISLFTLIETISVAKAYSEKAGEKFNASQEFVAQGLASIVGGFFSSIPTSGSPSRTTINYENGAKTKYAGVISGIIVLIAGFLLSKLIIYIPLASLAGIVIFSAISLIDLDRINALWKTRRESKIIYLLTLIATLFLDIQYAIYIGIALSIFVYLSRTSHLKISLIDFEGGEIVESEFFELDANKKPYVILNLEGSLHFAAVEEFEAKVKQVIKTEIPNIILRFRRTDDIGSSGIMVLKRLKIEAEKKGITLYYCGLSQELMQVFQDADLAGMNHYKTLYSRQKAVYSSEKEIIKLIQLETPKRKN